MNISEIAKWILIILFLVLVVYFIYAQLGADGMIPSIFGDIWTNSKLP